MQVQLGLLYVSIYNKTVITWSDFDHSSSICIEQITLVQEIQ